MTRQSFVLGALALSLGLLVAGCPDMPNMSSLSSSGPTPGTGTTTGSTQPASGSTQADTSSAQATPSAATLNLAYESMPANSWTVGSPMAHERVGLSAGVVGDRLYVTGGDGEATMELYDPSTDSWRMHSLPTTDNPANGAYAPYRARYFGAAVTVGKRLFFFGGTSYRLIPFLDIFDPEAQTWLDLWSPTFLDAGFARMGHAAVNLNGVIYLLGGLMDQGQGEPSPTADVYAFSTLSTENYLKPSLPAPRVGLGAAVLGNRILVTGGYGAMPTTGSPEATSSTLCYSAGEWLTTTASGAPLASLNVPRHSFGSAVLNGKWYVAGGMDSAGHVLDSVEEYDPSTNAWKFKAPMLSPRVHLALSALGDRLYALGGYDAQNHQLRTVDVFRP